MEKIQKVLAASGLGSRREIEGWIERGRIVVNGKPAHIGQRVSSRDRIEVDGSKVRVRPQLQPQIIVLNKLAGTVCSRHDEAGRNTIYDALPKLHGGRWIGVGRLDMQTTGLLLVTNDGALAHKMMHPATGLDREYAVRIDQSLDEPTLRRLRHGIEVEGELLRFSDIRYYNGSERNFWYHVVLMGGKNREVRRLFAAAGCVVSRLKRVRYGPVVMPAWLKSGQWARLTEDDVSAIYKLLGLQYPGLQNPGLRNTSPQNPGLRHKAAASRSGKTRRPAGEAKGSVLLPYPELQT